MLRCLKIKTNKDLSAVEGGKFTLLQPQRIDGSLIQRKQGLCVTDYNSTQGNVTPQDFLKYKSISLFGMALSQNAYFHVNIIASSQLEKWYVELVQCMDHVNAE